MIKLIIVFVLCCSKIVYGQLDDSIIPLKVFLNDSIQQTTGDLIINFRTSNDTFLVRAEDNRIEIPSFPKGTDYVSMEIEYKDYKAFIPNVSVKQNLTYKEEVGWRFGFDSYPFNVDIIKEYPINNDVREIFYWIIDYDEIEDLLVIPLNNNY